MSEQRPSLRPIPGALFGTGGFVGVDLSLATFSTQATITAFRPTVNDPPSGGAVVVRLHDGAGDFLESTIPDGQREGNEATGSLVIAAGGELFQTVQSVGGDPWSAQNLSGYYVLVGGAAPAPAGAYLTTRELVKQQGGITGTASDVIIDTLIAAVSRYAERYCGRALVPAAITDEVHSVNEFGAPYAPVCARQWPVTNLKAKIDGTDVPAGDLEVETENGFAYYLQNSKPAGWPIGFRHIRLEYTGGYQITPPDLQDACTEEVRHQLTKTAHQGKGVRLGMRSRITGEEEGQFLTRPFSDRFMETLALYKRRSASSVGY